jgi:hypothetical protein
VQYLHTSTFAQLESGCVMTGQYYTGEYQTWCVEIPEELTGGNPHIAGTTCFYSTQHESFGCELFIPRSLYFQPHCKRRKNQSEVCQKLKEKRNS